MNLLGLLLKAMTAKTALEQIAKKTGLSEKQIKTLMSLAIPILIKYLTKNASSGDGASSLLNALTQHTSKKDMDSQLKEADEVDGGKIISHILGKKKKEVTQNLSSQSGLSAEQVSQILAIMAPALLTGVSEAASNTTAAQGTAAPTLSLGSTPGIFSALLGTAASSQQAQEEQNSATNGMALLQALLGARK
jgi:hypothetical protein